MAFEAKGRQMSRALRVLVAEDEYFLATDLARYLTGLGLEVVGPAADVDEAAELAPFADAAVLDINLAGRLAFPIADQFASRGAPFVFISGYEDIVLPDRFQHASMLPKPANWRDVAASLRERGILERIGTESDIRAMIAPLRIQARLLVRDNPSADRLVERTLERAIANFADAPDDLPLPQWLHECMIGVLEGTDRDVFN